VTVRVAVAGGNGKVAVRLTRLLTGRGDEVRSLIRDAQRAGDVRAAGGEPVVCDLEVASEDEVGEAVGGADAVVFAAGAGPGSGPERKWTVDYGGAVKLIAAARAQGSGRYVMLSSIGADAHREGEDTFDVYLRAKGQADMEVRGSGLAYTIVRPVGLTDEPGTGLVRLGEQVGPGEISRDDVAAVLAAVLAASSTERATFEVASGEQPVEEAVASVHSEAGG
jgi:uncharacterized protein YbjT (DUF2867 family)